MTVLVVCATHRDRRELALLGNEDACIMHDYASIELEELAGTPSHQARPIGDPEVEIERLVELARRRRVSGVFSTDDYPGTALAAIVASKLGLPGPSPRATIGAQHKYWARRIMRDAVPEATPEFGLSRGEPPRLLATGPVFAKPCKSFFSVGAHAAERAEDWPAAARGAVLPAAFFDLFDRLSRAYAAIDLTSRAILVERAVESGGKQRKREPIHDLVEASCTPTPGASDTPASTARSPRSRSRSGLALAAFEARPP